jgi:glycosyltransferase involved in cell wall biosynthesis
LINDLKINNQVIFDMVPYAEVPRCIAESKVGLINFLPHPNNIHGLPNKLFEYLAVGIPVIASDFPNYHNIVVKEKVGYCVDPTNPLAISEVMQTLANNDPLRMQMGENGRTLVKNKYNWDIVSEKLLMLIKNIIYES